MTAKIVLHAVSISLFSALMTLGLYLVFFPPADWGQLWNVSILDVPFIFFLLIQLLLIGFLWGAIQSSGMKKQVLSIEQQVDDLRQGRAFSKTAQPQTAEFSRLSDKVSDLQRMWNEQIKMNQRLASEKVEQQEQKIQEMVSLERQRLARDLHDSVSQQLFAASMLMSAINETEEENRQLKMVEKMIHQSQVEMRALLLHLRPAALKGKTLSEGIEELLIELKQKVPLDISWKAEQMELARGIEDHLFRILQESISNTLRHAEASMLNVLCILRDGSVILRVSDDGKGFDLTEDKAGSYGLNNMRERAAEIGGSLKIVSLPEQGTRLEIKVPFEGKEELT
ncbi:sensor histidine kinase [Jeotgalibacillus haloalkalitolerans]|uniref:Sensor histidine kinase n=1 Tax=Jeotgalibacillus haloalkalitolerans TaxID=3104292 RepID=A0ABU5KQ82_9BACL|nr:sensor histidine kinase [Jeotgalibacillus sp. HH7-29]MDZ5713418.1 sensor histidine kinase [Jeotgalibacillus sp. HH7-29]